MSFERTGIVLEHPLIDKMGVERLVPLGVAVALGIGSGRVLIPDGGCRPETERVCRLLHL